MLLDVPLVDQLFKHHGFVKMVRYMSSSGDCRRTSLAKVAGVSPVTAWVVLKTLRKTGHVTSAGCKWISEDFITVNLRDVVTDALFRYRGTRSLLYLACKDQVSLSEVARISMVSYPALKKLVAKLRKANILTEENRVRGELLRQPESPLDLIPRKEHRNTVRFFLGESRSTAPMFVYGDASWGREVLEIDMLALVEDIGRDAEPLVDDLVKTASSTTTRYGFGFDITVATLTAWFENRLAEVPEATLLEAEEGICIRGSPPSDEDYFERVEGAVDEDRVSELLMKGYIKQTEKGYVYTDKALRAFKRRPATIVKTMVKVDEKEIKILSASMRQKIDIY